MSKRPKLPLAIGLFLAAVPASSQTLPVPQVEAGALGFGAGQMTSVAFLGDGSVITENDRYPLATFSTVYDQADVAIGRNRISVDDPDRYRISGASRDGRITWNLSCLRDAGDGFKEYSAIVP